MKRNAWPSQVKIMGQEPARRGASLTFSVRACSLRRLILNRPVGPGDADGIGLGARAQAKKQRHAFIGGLLVAVSGPDLHLGAYRRLEVLDSGERHAQPGVLRCRTIQEQVNAAVRRDGRQGRCGRRRRNRLGRWRRTRRVRRARTGLPNCARPWLRNTPLAATRSGRAAVLQVGERIRTIRARLLRVETPLLVQGQRNARRFGKREVDPTVIVDIDCAQARRPRRAARRAAPL